MTLPLSLAVCAGLCICVPMAGAQEGWPFSEWNEPQRKEASPAVSNEVLRPMAEPPSFGDPRRRGPNPYPYRSQSTPRSAPSNASPSFATPADVDRADLTPLPPVDNGGSQLREPAIRGSDPYTTPANTIRRPQSISPYPPSSPIAGAGGLDAASEARLLKTLNGSPKSRTLRELLTVVLANATASSGRESGEADAFERLDARYRLGFLSEAAGFTIPAGIDRDDTAWAALALRRAQANAALGRADEACADVRDIIAAANELAAKDKDLAIMLSGYCGAHANTTAAVTLAADVARERSGFDPAGLAGLEAMAQGARPHIPSQLDLSPLSYRMLQKAGADPAQLVAARADVPLLVAMAGDPELPGGLRVGAAEKAAAAFVIPSEGLAKAYSNAPRGADIEQMHSGRDARTDGPSMHRARMYSNAVRQPTPLRKVRLVRAFLDSSARAGLYMPALELMAEPVASLRPVHEIGWFAETAVEVLLISGRIEEARRWLHLAREADPRGPEALAHWAALVDIADASRSAKRGESLASLERMALRGDFRAAELHRLATVLDALDYHVPIPLWEAASRTPQPTDGHLPATGLLSELQEASKSRDSQRTILLVLNAIGPDGPAKAHMISLGDSIRALKRVGMEREARRLGVEALFAEWPRSAQG